MPQVEWSALANLARVALFKFPHQLLDERTFYRFVCLAFHDRGADTGCVPRGTAKTDEVHPALDQAGDLRS